MSFDRRPFAACALAVLALGLNACAPSETQPDGDLPPIADSARTESPGATNVPKTDASAAGEGTGEPSADGDVGDGLDVTVVGDRGVLALRHTGAVPDGATGPTDRKLITGPGGCFAVTNDGPPQLLVFPPDATFVLQNRKPSVTVAGSETHVGGILAVDTTAVAKSAATGIPDRCAQGSDGTLLVVR